jgi:hypothetical protein
MLKKLISSFLNDVLKTTSWKYFGGILVNTKRADFFQVFNKNSLMDQHPGNETCTAGLPDGIFSNKKSQFG